MVMANPDLAEARLLLAYRCFYHVTERSNWKSIGCAGLLPSHEYRRYFDRPVVFLCTEQGLPAAKEMFRQGLPDDPPLLVLSVRAEAVAQHRCDPDWSFEQWVPRSMSLADCLNGPGLFVCYGVIPPEHLRVHESQDEAGDWHPGGSLGG